MSPLYRLAIFDSDGTLADSFPWFRDVINDVADRFGFPRLDDARIEALRACRSGDLVRELGVPRWKMPLIIRHMRRLKAEASHRLRPFPGVPAALQRLKAAGVTLAVVSSDLESNVRCTLGPANAALIDHYACSAPLFGKPARMRRLLRRGGFRPGEAIAIGDEIRDMEAARAVGITFGAVAWGYARPEVLVAGSPAVLFASVEEIPAHVIGG